MNASTEEHPVPSAQAEQRYAVFVSNETKKTMIARLTVKPNEQGAGITVEGDSDEGIRDVRNVIQKLNSEKKEERRSGFDPATTYGPERLIDALCENGFGVEDISAGDHQIEFQFDLDSGIHVAAHKALHGFAEPNDPVGRRVAEAIANAMRQPASDATQAIKAAVEGGEPIALVAAIKSGLESGAMNLRPTPALCDSLFSFDIAIIPSADRRTVRECRLLVAHMLGRAEAAVEAREMLQEEADNLDEKQKADLEMIIAIGEMKKGHSETALHIWRKLLERPEVLGPDNRGWAWRNIALSLSRDNPEKRHAIQCSVDAFLQAGDKKEASRSLMMLANNLLHEEPATALSKIDEILLLIEQNGLLDRELRAATLHARGNRFLRMGRNVEAAADAREAATLRRGLIGVEQNLISSLHLGEIANRAAGNIEDAGILAAEAKRLTEEINAPHFKLAQRVSRLLQTYDAAEADQLLQDAEQQKNIEVIASVYIAKAMNDSSLGESERLAVLEDALIRLEKAGASQAAKEPARLALAGLLQQLGQPERAERLYREVLDANPFSIAARGTLVQSLWNREKWGDAAIILKKQIDLRGPMPGLCCAYGRSLFEAGDLSSALPALTQALDLAGDDGNLKRLANDLREKILHQDGVILSGPIAVNADRAVIREEFETAIDEFCQFISAMKRMSFWAKKNSKRVWVGHPERRGQDFLHTFLKAKFGDRIDIFEEIDSGAGRLDIYVTLRGGLAVIVELKMCGGGYSSNYAAAGETQLLHYMRNRRSNLGYLIVFDARVSKFGEVLLTGDNSQTVCSKFIDMRPHVIP